MTSVKQTIKSAATPKWAVSPVAGALSESATYSVVTSSGNSLIVTLTGLDPTKPVFVMLDPKNGTAANGSDDSCTYLSPNSTLNMQVVRSNDNVVLGREADQVVTGGGWETYLPAVGYMWVDPTPLASSTYQLEIAGAPGAIVGILQCRLVAFQRP
jgi:hypothetical protein